VWESAAKDLQICPFLHIQNRQSGSTSMHITMQASCRSVVDVGLLNISNPVSRFGSEAVRESTCVVTVSSRPDGQFRLSPKIWRLSLESGPLAPRVLCLGVCTCACASVFGRLEGRWQVWDCPEEIVGETKFVLWHSYLTSLENPLHWMHTSISLHCLVFFYFFGNHYIECIHASRFIASFSFVWNRHRLATNHDPVDSRYAHNHVSPPTSFTRSADSEM